MSWLFHEASKQAINMSQIKCFRAISDIEIQFCYIDDSTATLTFEDYEGMKNGFNIILSSVGIEEGLDG